MELYYRKCYPMQTVITRKLEYLNIGQSRLVDCKVKNVTKY